MGIYFTLIVGESGFFLTPDDNQWNHGWVKVQRKSSFVFSVRACKDAHILMAARPGRIDRDVYEIVLGAGGNTYSTIRAARLSQDRATARTPGEYGFKNDNAQKHFQVYGIGLLVHIPVL